MAALECDVAWREPDPGPETPRNERPFAAVQELAARVVTASPSRNAFTLRHNVALAVSVISLVGAPLFGRLDSADPGARRRRIVLWALAYTGLFALIAFVHSAWPDIAGLLLIGLLSGFLVWRYAGVNTFGSERDEALAMHPTVKPVRLVADAILDCSRRGDRVLDGFSGSGTTLLAADRTGRIGYGLEIEPRYVDAALRRLVKHAGLEAVHVESGQTFDEIAADRASNTDAGPPPVPDNSSGIACEGEEIEEARS